MDSAGYRHFLSFRGRRRYREAKGTGACGPPVHVQGRGAAVALRGCGTPGSRRPQRRSYPARVRAEPSTPFGEFCRNRRGWKRPGNDRRASGVLAPRAGGEDRPPLTGKTLPIQRVVALAVSGTVITRALSGARGFRYSSGLSEILVSRLYLSVRAPRGKNGRCSIDRLFLRRSACRVTC